MKNVIRILFMAVLLLPVLSCYTGRPIVTETPVNNQTYTVDYLFEHDGCKVYRFYDGRAKSYVYFTNCNGDVTSIRNDSTKKRVTNSVRISYDDQGTLYDRQDE